MTKIREYLLNVAKALHARDRVPVVAIDCIAAKKRAEIIEQIAREVADLSEDEALAVLKGYRARFLKAASEPADNGIGWVFSMSETQWIEGVVDVVARENVGWIEVSSSGYDGKSRRLLNLPSYSRKLGVNHGVAYIARGKDEADAAWLARRSEWLSRYHADIPVSHSDSPRDQGVPQSYIYGTVGEFAQVEHLVEAGIATIRGWKMEDGSFLELVEAFVKPREDGVLATARQKEGQPRPLGRVSMAHYDIELVA